MKKICIISVNRSGSNFLSEHFPTNNIQFNAKELYTGNMPSWERHLTTIMDQPNRLPKSWRDFAIAKIARSKHNITYDMLLDLAAVYDKKQYEYFIYKVQIHQINSMGINIQDIIDSNDVVLFNYRKSILKTYISAQIAEQTKCFMIWRDKPEAETTREEYIKNINNVHIDWDSNDFIQYSTQISAMYDQFLPFINEHNLIQYENLCDANDTVKVIAEKINNINKECCEVTIRPSNIMKQIEDHYKYIQNPNKFMDDIANIDRKYVMYTKFEQTQ